MTVVSAIETHRKQALKRASVFVAIEHQAKLPNLRHQQTVQSHHDLPGKLSHSAFGTNPLHSVLCNLECSFQGCAWCTQGG